MKSNYSILCLLIMFATAGIIFAGNFPLLPDSADKLEASSTLKDKYNIYNVSHLFDRTWASWCEGEKDSGAGTSITIGYIRQVSFDTLYLKNGFGLRKYFSLNNRVKTLLIESSSGQNKTVELKDTPDVQRIQLEKALTGKIFTLKIIDVYSGKKFNDTCISEISFTPVAIQDNEAMPAFRSLSFVISPGGFGGSRIILKYDGSVEGEHMLGHQCGTPIVSGTWKKNSNGSVDIRYTWADPVNCGDMEATEMKTVKKSGYVKLIRFEIDGIINSDGHRARRIRIK